MDSQKPDEMPMEADLEAMEDEEEFEVTREELITALQEVVRELSEGLKGADRDAYLSADDLAQNDWFFAGVSDEEGQYAVTMWPAEGEEDMLRIDIGTETDVHELASNPDQAAALTDDFIEAMSEEYEYEEYDEDEEEGDEEDEEFDEDLEEEEFEDEEELEEELSEEDEAVRRDGNRPLN
jgi:hypothetical protein